MLKSKWLAVLLGMLIFSSAQSETTDDLSVWDTAYNETTKQRFIPVELFTGGVWDGKHELKMKAVSSTACAVIVGRDRPCDKIELSGPFTTQNKSSIAWAGDTISYYLRTFTVRSGKVTSFFTINNSKDGLVRIFDERKQWGARSYDGLGSKFPLGYWQQGEVRTYHSKRPTRIEIIELNGPDHCLTFRWTVGDGKSRNSDNTYTFCPGKGFSKYESNYSATN